MVELHKATIQELKEEIESRVEKPIQLLEPDFSLIVRLCQEYIDTVSDENIVDYDAKHYIFEAADSAKHCIFEAAMEAVFGGKVWDFITAKIE